MLALGGKNTLVEKRDKTAYLCHCKTMILGWLWFCISLINWEFFCNILWNYTCFSVWYYKYFKLHSFILKRHITVFKFQSHQVSCLFSVLCHNCCILKMAWWLKKLKVSRPHHSGPFQYVSASCFWMREHVLWAAPHSFALLLTQVFFFCFFFCLLS